MKNMMFVSMPLLQAAAPSSPNFLITLLPFIVLTVLIIAIVTYSKAFKKTGQKGAWKYMLGVYGIFLGSAIIGQIITIPIGENEVIRVTIIAVCAILGLTAGLYNCYRGLRKAKTKAKEIAAKAFASEKTGLDNVVIQTNRSERKITREDMAGKDLRTNAIQKCPKCGSAKWRPLRLLGYTGRTWMMFFLGLIILLLGLIIGFGVLIWFLIALLGPIIGIGIASLFLRRKKNNDPFILKCEDCGEKWEAPPLEADEEEWLESPCKITISRPTGFVGALIGQYVFLNGIRIDILKNGKALSFQTNVKHNILYCTDHLGAVFQDYRCFEAEPGGSESFSFNRKFL
jgi:hypothetical protein